MTSKLNRLFSSLIEIPKSKYGLGFAQSNPSIISTSTRREFVCSTGQQQQQEKPKNSAEEDISAPLSETNEKIENLSENEIEDEDEDDGELVNSDGERINRETGEIGGPKGPEPTRYGDWERGGRCSDF